MPKALRITIDGVEREAVDVYRAHGVSRQLFHLRMKNGWRAIEAATTPPIRAVPKAKVGRAPGDSRRGPISRLRDVTDGTDVNLQATARRNGIGRDTFNHRLKAGWPPVIAAILPLGEVGAWRDAPRSAGGRPRSATPDPSQSPPPSALR